MIRFLNCLTIDHDWRLVVLAQAVCLLAGLVCAETLGRAFAAEGGRRSAWIWLAAAVAASGVWATHFIAMLAYRPVTELEWQVAGTLGSYALAALGAWAAFSILSGRPGAPIRPALMFAAGVVGMHLLGQAAFARGALLIWSPYGFAAATLVGLAGALTMVFALGRRRGSVRLILAALGFTLCVGGTHFVAMSSTLVAPLAPSFDPPGGLPRLTVALLAMGQAVGIAVMGFAILAIDGRARIVANQRLRRMVDSLPVATALFDAQDRLLSWNEGYERLKGGEPGSLRAGLTFESLLRESVARGNLRDASPDVETWIARRLEQRRNAPCSTDHETIEGRWIRVEDRPAPDGCVVSVCMDLTEERRAVALLQEARAEAAAAAQAKGRFLALLGHELRTPLNGVIGLADVLLRTPLNDHQRTCLDMLKQSALRLSDLHADLFDLSGATIGPAASEQRAFSIRALLEEVAAGRLAAAAAKGLYLRVEAPETEVVGDRRRLMRMLEKLVDNAVCFSDRGGVRLAAAPPRRGKGPWRLRVIDTGPGVDEGERERLMRGFEVGDGSDTRGQAGAGLGLAVVRQLAETTGARLRLKSARPHGLVAELEVKLGATHEAGAPAKPLRVLAVDDHPTNRRVMEMILSPLGAEVALAENGAEAVEQARLQDFDLVLMDIQMPVMDGLEAVRRIRADEADRNRPMAFIAIVSASANPEHVEAGRLAGADTHIAKPVTVEGLAALIDAAEARKPAPALARVQSPTPPALQMSA